MSHYGPVSESSPATGAVHDLVGTVDAQVGVGASPAQRSARSGRLRRPGLLGLFVADTAATLSAFLAADQIRFSLSWGATVDGTSTFVSTPLLLLVAGAWIATALGSRLYERPRAWSWPESFRSALVAGVVADALLAAALYLSYREVSRLLFLYYVGAHLAGLVVVRMALWAVDETLLGGVTSRHRVLVLGADEHATAIAASLERHGRVEVVGPIPGPPPAAGGDDLDHYLETLADRVELEGADEILVASTDVARQDLLALMGGLRRHPVHVALVPDLGDVVTARASFEDLAGLPIIGLHEPAIRGTRWVFKRIFDIVVSLVVLVPALPILATVAAAVWLEDGGPVLFRQERIGQGGRKFRMLKFRTMRNGAERDGPRVARRAEDGRMIHKEPDDPRVTRVGQFLRRFGLDELPQLVHVLTGTMSIVGPRPELPEIVAEYEPWQYRRFAAAPGITGWWQVNRDHGIPMHFQTELDIYYLMNHSFALDLKIIFRTFGVLLTGRGAY